MNEFRNRSEYAVRPGRVLVHDPVAAGAFERRPGQGHEAAGARGSTQAAPVNGRPGDILFREWPDPERLAEQHATFVSLLEEHVSVIRLTDLVPSDTRDGFGGAFRANPNFLFTHDALITLPWAPDIWIRGSMRESIRRGESPVVERAARALGLEEVPIARCGCLEGGDVIPIEISGRRVLLVGFGPRTERDSIDALYHALSERDLVDEVLGIEIAPWRLNLDGCFFPVARDLAVTHPDSVLRGIAVDESGSIPVDPLDRFRANGFRILEVGPDESFLMQACNFFCAGDGTLIAYGMTERVNDALRGAGLTVRSFDGSELVKGNGGPHCMTRPIYARSHE